MDVCKIESIAVLKRSIGEHLRYAINMCTIVELRFRDTRIEPRDEESWIWQVLTYGQDHRMITVLTSNSEAEEKVVG